MTSDAFPRIYTADEIRAERDRLSELLSQTEGYVTALQSVLWEWVENSKHLSPLETKRLHSVCTLVDAMEKLCEQIDTPEAETA